MKRRKILFAIGLVLLPFVQHLHLRRMSRFQKMGRREKIYKRGGIVMGLFVFIVVLMSGEDVIPQVTLVSKLIITSK